jgi:hypothetical protein
MRSFADSGEVLRKGSTDYRRFRKPWLDSFHMETTGSTAELPSHSSELEMALTDGDQTWLGLGFRNACRKLWGRKRTGIRSLSTAAVQII